ncbi:MAG: hypothetical protein RR343_06665 [Oscillospiraceae bacterium]
MDRDKLKVQIEELMQQYADEKINSNTYFKKMMELTALSKDENEENLK